MTNQWKAAALAAAIALLAVGCAGKTGQAAAESALPTAAATQAPTQAPTPSPAPSGNPLTGLAGDIDYANQRPVAVQLRTLDGAAPLWGVSRADVLIEGVTEGKTASLMALFARADDISKAGPVGGGRDLMLQFALPLNALAVHIDKNQYAKNLLNVLSYQDIDGYNVGKAGFGFDADRAASGYREENCFYTTAELVKAGAADAATAETGATVPLFRFGERPAPAAQNGTELYVTFSDEDTEALLYSADTGLYQKNNADGSPMMDADAGAQAAFTNVFVLYASSGVKDDGYTRQYDLAGGTGLYLTGGGWQEIRWQKGDAAAPLALSNPDGTGLTVSPGKSFIAVYGGYYGQSLRLLGADGAEQTLPAKPALLASGIPDEVAASAEENYKAQQEAVAASEAALAAEQEAAASSDAAAVAASDAATEPADAAPPADSAASSAAP